MNGSETTDSLSQLRNELEKAIEELEATETELSECTEWTNEATSRLNEMNSQDKEAVSKQASGLKTELRVIDGPNGLIDFTDRLKDSFSKPVERSALQGLEDVIQTVGVDLPQDRISELRKTVKSRTSRDLQKDADEYKRAIALLEGEPEFTVSLVAKEIDTDEARYLIGPGRELLPLIKKIQSRRENLIDIEGLFDKSGQWVPKNIYTLTETERHYANTDLSVSAIEKEIDAIDEILNDIKIPVDVSSVVQSDLKDRLDGVPVTEFQSELNTVATKLTTLSTTVEDTLLSVKELTTLQKIPDSLIQPVSDVSTELSEFESQQYHSLSNLLGAANTVEKEYDQFLNKVSEELKLLEQMHAQLSVVDELEGIESPSSTKAPSELDQMAVQNTPEGAFDVILAYREWINTALEQLSGEFTGEEVGALFERLYTEDTVELSSVDLDTLRELQNSVPIVISLQQ